jgi:CubicO group peptidase (beta-lactamase class C family)
MDVRTIPLAGGLACLEEALDGVVPDALEAGKVPGAVILVGRRTQTGYQTWQKAYGFMQIEPQRVPMRGDAIFDMASLTKPIATGTSLMVLAEQGRLSVEDPVGKYLPEFNEGEKQNVKIRHLMTHTSGMPPYVGAAEQKVIKAEAGFPCAAAAREYIRELELARPAGEAIVYSCLNAILCAEIVEAVSGQPLDEFAAEHIFKPLRMADTGFVRFEPLVPSHSERSEESGSGRAAGLDSSVVRRGGLPRNDTGVAARSGNDTGVAARPRNDVVRFVPTTKTDYGRGEGGFLRGQVHDPLAAMQAGVSGNAGLFSTAADLSRFAQMMLNGGTLDGARVLKEETIREMTRVQNPGARNLKGVADRRGLLWDLYVPDPGDTGADALFSYGHVGYTGTAIRIYPEQGVYVIALANRVHPDDSGKVGAFRQVVWDAVGEMLLAVSGAAEH